jgi:hypothetical protein
MADEEERGMADEEERGPGSLHEALLKKSHEPYFADMEREDAEQLRDYEAYGPSTSSAMEQAGFESVLFKVAGELGYEEDFARYMCKRDSRLTVLDSFHAVDQRLKVKKFDFAMAEMAANNAGRDKRNAERDVRHHQELAAIHAASDKRIVQHHQEMADISQRI